MAEAAAAAKRGTDPVARNAVWSEHIRRELATQKINTTFTINASKSTRDVWVERGAALLTPPCAGSVRHYAEAEHAGSGRQTRREPR